MTSIPADMAIVRRDPEDIVEIDGVPATPIPGKAGTSGRPWKMIWFQCCHVYGRIYRNQQQTEYRGPCPKCGAIVEAGIGPGGTNRSIFTTR